MSIQQITTSKFPPIYTSSDKDQCLDTDKRCIALFNKAFNITLKINETNDEKLNLKQIKIQHENKLSEAIDLFALSFRVFRDKHGKEEELLIDAERIAKNSTRLCKSKIANLKIPIFLNLLRKDVNKTDFINHFTLCTLEIRCLIQEYSSFDQHLISFAEKNDLLTYIDEFKKTLHTSKVFSAENLDAILPSFNLREDINFAGLYRSMNHFVEIIGSADFHETVSFTIIDRLQKKTLRCIGSCKESRNIYQIHTAACKTFLYLKKIAELMQDPENPDQVNSSYSTELKALLIRLSIKSQHIRINNRSIIDFATSFIKKKEPSIEDAAEETEKNIDQDLYQLYHAQAEKVCQNLSCISDTYEYIQRNIP